MPRTFGWVQQLADATDLRLVESALKIGFDELCGGFAVVALAMQVEYNVYETFQAWNKSPEFSDSRVHLNATCESRSGDCIL